MSWFLRRSLRGCMVLFSWFVIPYSWMKCARIKNVRLPPLANPLLEIPVIELAARIRTGHLKSEEVVRAYVERCNEVNPLINAVVEDCFDAALEEAKKVDLLVASKQIPIEVMGRDTPMLGVPVTIKESIGVAGMSNQSGRRYNKKRNAIEDAPAVAQIKKSGAIVILVSNTPELCLQWETYNHVTKLTKNPYNLKRTVGGSSGGEAALIGAGASVCGLSSDIGGSVRLPAMFVGVFGHKPTPYLVSPLGHVPCSSAPNWGDFFTIAPMCRYACDLPLVLKAMAQPGLRQNELIIENLKRDVHLKDIKIYYMDDDGPSGIIAPMSTDMKAGMKKVVEFLNADLHKFKRLKHAFHVSTTALLRLEDLETIFNEKLEGEKNKSLYRETLKYFFGLSDYTLACVMLEYLQMFANSTPESRLKTYEEITQALKNDFKTLLGDNGVFLYPTFPATAHGHYRIFHKLVDTSYLVIFNALGLPVTNAMIGLDRNNLPMGIQIVANPGNDHLTIKVAIELEKKFGGWVPPSTLHSSSSAST